MRILHRFKLLGGVDDRNMANITEEWIRERVGLNHENLEDVKSLSLPGTYHEKIASVGTSIRKFTRIKNLDLSRNALTTLEGLQSCELLESLNLYYNSLNTLEDLSPLRHNAKLINLDLRLNPVARTEADYRLFVVNLLPNLRVLDDRPVRESEREAALQHFGHVKNVSETEELSTPAKSSSRARIVPSGFVTTTMDAEDRAVLNILAKTEAPPPENSGSATRQPILKEYDSEGLRQLADAELCAREEIKLDSKSLASFTPTEQSVSSSEQLCEDEPTDDTIREEADAYTAYTGKSHFTANPHHAEEARPYGGKGDISRPTHAHKLAPSLIQLLDIVDKYWNGSKSLHDNKKFLKLATDMQAKMASESSRNLKDEIMELKNENKELRATVRANEGLKKVKVKLDEADKEMDKMRGNISELQKENTQLRYALQMDKKSSGSASSYEVEQLKQENQQLQFKLKQFSQMSELAKMLQESHKSLVQTNDHLLRDIEDLRLKLKHSDIYSSSSYISNSSSYK